jgi:hypothetical protein
MTAAPSLPRTSAPAPQPDRTARPLPVRAGVLLAFLVVGTAVQLVRTPGLPAWNSLGAEDGGIFYTDALNDPLVTTIGRAYEGYLHVVPRLIAAFASLLPVRDAAVVINGFGALVVALLAAYVWAVASDVLPSRWGRGLLVLLMLVLPTAGWELNASINNLHWYLDFAVLWVFLARPASRGLLVCGVVVAAAAALSDPLAALALPLVAYRVLQTMRTRPLVRSELAAPVVFVVGLVLQAVYGVSEKAPHAFVERNWRDLPGTYGLRVVGSLVVGDRFLPDLFARHGRGFAYLLLLVGVAGAAGAVAVAYRRRAGLILLGYSAVFLAVPLLIRGTAIYLDQTRPTLNGSRYMLVPVLTLATAVLIGLFSGRLRSPVPAVLTTIVVVVVVVASYRMESSRSDGPAWSSGVRAAEQRCADTGGDVPGSRASARNPWATVVGPGQVAIPGVPGRDNRSSWNVVVDCSRLGGG